jgi:hypothetical protein
LPRIGVAEPWDTKLLRRGFVHYQLIVDAGDTLD